MFIHTIQYDSILIGPRFHQFIGGVHRLRCIGAFSADANCRSFWQNERHQVENAFAVYFLVRLTPEPKPISFGTLARKGRLSPATEKFWQCAKEVSAVANLLRERGASDCSWTK